MLCLEDGREVFEDGECDLRVVEECGRLDGPCYHERDDGPCHLFADPACGGRSRRARGYRRGRRTERARCERVVPIMVRLGLEPRHEDRVDVFAGP